MLPIFTFSPYLTLLFATVFQMIMVMGFILAPNDYTTDKRGKNAAYNVFMQVGFGLYFLFGIFFIDTAVFWLIGQWTLADWQFQLPAVILLLIIGVQYVIGAWLINPTKFDLIFFGISVPLLLILLHIVPGYIITDIENSLYVTLGVMILTVIIYVIIKSKIILPQNATPKYKWNITAGYKRIFNRKYNVVLYIFLAAESILKILGSSLLIDWAVLAGIIFALLVLFVCDRFHNHMKVKGRTI